MPFLAGCGGFSLDGPGPVLASPPVSSAPSERTLGPDGIGPFEVGMSLDEAEATGQFEARDEDPKACMTHTSPDDIRVGWSSKLGITTLTAENVRTPEGIGAGSTFAEVKRAYPKPAEAGDMPFDEQLAMMGVIWTAVPDRPDNMYAIKFDTSHLAGRAQFDQATVQVVMLKLVAEQNC
ncbi:hypothetical protein ACFYWX_18345 [Streptomyces sp. NPDC002888]|uniref:hypothetical protein n=1 Tax=Streptomyces sp. NPDC002888 TaxID=3364668 RepID=UPI0036BF60E9